MAVRPVAGRPAGDAAEADLEQLEPVAVLIIAGVKQVRAVGKAGRIQRLRRALAQKAAHHVENPPQGMGTAGQGRGVVRFQQRTPGDAHVDQVVEAVVEEDLRVEQVDGERAEKHPEHIFAQEEINRAFRLRVGAGKIEYGPGTLPPETALYLVRPAAHAIVTHVVLETARFFRHDHLDDLFHGGVVALQHQFHGGVEHVIAETFGQLNAAPGRGIAGGDQGIQVETVPLRGAHVVQYQFQDIGLQLPFPVKLCRGDANTFLENGGCLYRDTPWGHPAVIRHVSEHGGPGDMPVVFEDGHQYYPVRQVGYRRSAHVRIVGKNDVALFELPFVGIHQAVDE